MKHVKVGELWLQEHLGKKTLELKKYPTKDNCGDLGTKPTSEVTLQRLLRRLNMVNLCIYQNDMKDDDWGKMNYEKLGYDCHKVTAILGRRKQ